MPLFDLPELAGRKKGLSGLAGRPLALKYWLTRVTHWAIVPSDDGTWETADGTPVRLLSANLLKVPGGAAEVVDIRWEEWAGRQPGHDEAVDAAVNLGIKPRAPRRGMKIKPRF